jgi:hypothetical protein
VLFQGIATLGADAFLSQTPLTTFRPGGFHPHLE